MDKPLISIIIPVYNSQDYLQKCLDSIVNQTYENLEIIIVNDGSTDNSGAIIDEYAKSDKRIMAFHKSNGGIGSAYNLALKHTTGDYITFVDSDDWAKLNLYEELIKTAKGKDPDFVSFGKAYVNSMGEFLKYNQRADKEIEGKDEILKFHFEKMKHPGLGRLFKKELFADVEIFNQNIGIDEMLTPQLLAKCNKAVYTSKVLYNILVREDSVSRITYSDKKISETLLVYQFICEFAAREMPDFVEYLQIKYLNVLFSLRAQNVRYDFFLQKETATHLFNEYHKQYLSLNNNKLFIQQSLLLKTRMYLLTKAPRLFHLFMSVLSYTNQWLKRITCRYTRIDIRICPARKNQKSL